MDEDLETRRSVPANSLDIEQMHLEAKNRWLSPAEICEILQNYKRFQIASEPPNMPPSGSLLLFDRKVVRYFRKDGHNWSRKKNGKLAKEGHKKLKIGSIEVLHCYYAHGEENENFQRRCYSMIEKDFSHIVLVHYLKETGKEEDSSCVKETEGANPHSQEAEKIMPNSEIDGSMSSGSHPNNCPELSENTDMCLNSAQALERENAQSDSFHEKISAIPGIDSAPTQSDRGKSDNDSGSTDDWLKYFNFSPCKDVSESCTPCCESIEYPSLSSFSHPDTIDKFLSNSVVRRLDFGVHSQIREESKSSVEDSSSLSKQPMDQKLYSDSACDITSKFHEQEVNHLELVNFIDPQQEHPDIRNDNSMENYFQLSNEKHDFILPPHSDSYLNLESCSSAMGQNLFDGILTEEGSKKRSSSGANSEKVENENENDVSSIPFILGPALSQEKLFSIFEFSPEWAYEGSKIKVEIRGRFLKSPHEVENCKWSCMFGDVDVPAEVMADGLLCCHAPIHEAGRVPFYIMSSNGLACSEVREFEYRVSHTQDINAPENFSDSANAIFLFRFGKILCLGSSFTSSVTSNLEGASQLSCKISSLLKTGIHEWDQMLNTSSRMEFSSEKVKEQLLQKTLKEKLHLWLLQKVDEGGKGLSVLDEGGQGVLHFAAAIGYDWALEPIIVAGVEVNFRDVNGWTALHWAASCGRENTVASLISLGAAPGALTDPSPKYPSGRTPADLASANGHKRIAVDLGKRSLGVPISSINLDNQDDVGRGPKAVQNLGNTSDGLSLVDVEKFDAGKSDPYVHQSYSNCFWGKLSAVPGMDLACIQAGTGIYDNDSGLSYESQKHLDSPLWEDILENCTPEMESIKCHSFISSTQSDTMGQFRSNNFLNKQEFGGQPEMQEECQMHPNTWIDNSMENGCQTQLSNGAYEYVLPNDSDGYLNMEGKSIYPSAIRQHLLDSSLTEEGLKKHDSFNPWMSKISEEIRDVTDLDESHIQCCAGVNWETVWNRNGIDVSSILSEGKMDTFMLGPFLSQDLFSIGDFSPNWAYVGVETEVLITGRFLKSPDMIKNCKWSCMFGEVEVPAEVVADGVLRCCAPTHEAGWVPIYVTSSNRLACSEVREFEYRVSNFDDMPTVDNNSGTSENVLLRFHKLLTLSSSFNGSDTCGFNISELSSKINLLLKEDTIGWEEMLLFSLDGASDSQILEVLLHRKQLKEKLRVWILQKVAEGGKGPSVLDEGGQGVLHFAAALGYDWAFEPTILAGVNVDFRDVNGWTALHWAASCGRERAVAVLISLGAAPGAVTDPSPKYPLGRTPADLASAYGHKGIAGYLAECSLSAHLSSLNLDKQDSHAADGAKAVQELSERTATPFSLGNTSDSLSLEDSLAAVRNATRALPRIYRVYRVQSFQKRQLKEYGDDKFAMSDERAISLPAVKSYKPGQKDEPVHAAAIPIQNKFRSWKGRKQFLLILEKIVKIQAHVRGHQVRKIYRKIIWCVGIVEKVILRWRRKGSGLRGFKKEALTEAPNIPEKSSKDDDDDFLKEGRKQTEERMQKALARVKSMVQYPEGRDQYRRLLNVVTEIQEKKVNTPGPSDFDEDLIDFEALLDDDTFMSTAT